MDGEAKVRRGAHACRQRLRALPCSARPLLSFTSTSAVKHHEFQEKVGIDLRLLCFEVMC